MFALFGMGDLSEAPIVRGCGRRRARYTCACTVVGMDSLNGAFVVRGYASVGAHTVLVQCSAWAA